MKKKNMLLILSALLALEQDGIDEWFTVDTAAIRVEGSSMGLREGDQATLRALAYGMLLPSGNDAAGAAAGEFDNINNLQNAFREDEVVPSYPRDEILKNVDGGEDGFFPVRKRQ